MSMNKVKLSQVVRDFIITLDHDDYVSNASDVAIRNLALRGIGWNYPRPKPKREP